MDFTIMPTEELIRYMENFNWSRKVKQLHVHHTWKPDHSDYTGKNGIDLQTAMRNYHVNVNGWSDIAQHLTLLPDGQWVTGRSFNSDPASIAGWNEGAFCIEMLGNFDTGFNKFEGRQAEAMFKFCFHFAKLMKLDMKNDIKFHRDNPNAGKTCPGSGIDREWFMDKLDSCARNMYNVQTIHEETWKINAVNELASSGILTDPLYWKDKINESMPVWAVLTICNRIYQKVGENNKS